ncbi:hypothetical protein [Pseudomonas aeruginosa]|uniref:hypothetical protein n=1 Tax=Pseudomonas aeruginosa TaxID=287 RepID=UPI002043B213|nr:hypothetical protein [Pseudomonas aeruginosa]MCM4075444.1 hypothetical protein [Pseudomonas aeruginosa]MCM4094344.1 hypothetical protein [Pseudomonas aeruginosa]MCM4108039.1 hypothetical protein [Pseudomonas aeruginosa]MCM4121345.1 hypothetical protein [Pseudomonas aeruginosa]
MSKHTPGPWEVRNRVEVFSRLGADSGDGCPAHATDGWMIADCEPGVNTLTEGGYSTELGLELKEANARLIAAAPELLEACQAFKRLYGRLWDVVEPSGSGFLSPESVKEYDAIHELMTAAIAKATA